MIRRFTTSGVALTRADDGAFVLYEDHKKMMELWSDFSKQQQVVPCAELPWRTVRDDDCGPLNVGFYCEALTAFGTFYEVFFYHPGEGELDWETLTRDGGPSNLEAIEAKYQGLDTINAPYWRASYSGQEEWEFPLGTLTEARLMAENDFVMRMAVALGEGRRVPASEAPHFSTRPKGPSELFSPVQLQIVPKTS